MPYFFLFSALMMVFAAIGFISSIVLARSTRGVATRLIQVAQGSAHVVQPKESLLLLLQRNVFGGVRWMRRRLGMIEDAKLLERFASAGFRTSVARDTYLAARMLAPVLAVLLASFIPSHRFVCMIALGGVGYLLPDMILSRLVKRHREKIRRSIPDAIDLLVICVDAGLGMDQAMLRVGQELGTSHPQIYEEFMQINREQRAGKLRLEAWQAMAARCKLPEIDGFVNMLMQNERFGTPIARALNSFGEDIRQKRRQRAEELAAKTTVKIIFPLVFFIFPSLFIVLLGPAGITIARGLSGALP